MFFALLLGWISQLLGSLLADLELAKVCLFCSCTWSCLHLSRSMSSWPEVRWTWGRLWLGPEETEPSLVQGDAKSSFSFEFSWRHSTWDLQAPYNETDKGQESQLTRTTSLFCSPPAPAPRQAKVPACDASSYSQCQTSLNTSRNSKRGQSKALGPLVPHVLFWFFSKRTSYNRSRKKQSINIKPCLVLGNIIYN